MMIPLPKQRDLKPYIEQGLVSCRTRPSGNYELGLYNYTNECQYSRAWDWVTLQCRGFVLEHGTNRVVARPFNKFFNIGEHRTTEWDKIPWDQDFAVVEKYDGALGIMYHHNGAWDIATRGAFDSWHAEYARQHYLPTLNQEAMEPGMTYLFEIIFPDEVIGALCYDWGGLVLIGMRDRMSGRSEWPTKLPAHAERIGAIPPRVYDAPDDIQSYVKSIYGLDHTREGVVLTFRESLTHESGLMVKVKSKEYQRIHRIIHGFSLKEIATWVARHDEYKLLSLVPDELRELVWQRLETLIAERDTLEAEEAECWDRLKEIEDQKAFALAVQEQASKPVQPLLFGRRKGADMSDYVAKAIYRKIEKEGA